MKRLFLAAVTMAAATSAHAAGIVITPVQLGLVGAAGSTVSGVINVSSPRAQANTVRIHFSDFSIDEKGVRSDVRGPDVSTRSCRTWLDVDQQQFVSPERGIVPVVVSAHIPANATGSYWAEAYFEAIPPPPAPNAAGRAPTVGISIVPRIGVPIIVTVQGTEKFSVKVEKLDAVRTASGIEASVLIENTGNAAVLLSGAVALERPTADAPEELFSKDIEPSTSYPGIRRLIKVIVPAQPTDLTSADLHAYLRFGPRPEHAVEASSKLQALLNAHQTQESTTRGN